MRINQLKEPGVLSCVHRIDTTFMISPHQHQCMFTGTIAFLLSLIFFHTRLLKYIRWDRHSHMDIISVMIAPRQQLYHY